MVMEPDYYGVGGWLLFFCFTTTFVGPAQLLYGAIRSRTPFERFWDIGLAAAFVFIGIKLWTNGPRAFFWVQVYFLVRFSLIAFLVIAVIISKRPIFNADHSFNSWLEAAMSGLAGVLMWWLYFKKSKRVRATYGANL